MFETMRKVFGPIAVAVIIGAIAMVFVFYGVFNPRGGGGGGRGGYSGFAAKVNGETIPIREFQQVYEQRIAFYQNMMKGKVDPALLEQLGIRKQIINELVQQKLFLQEAKKTGFVASDEEVREKIQELPYFKDKDTGKFSATQYKKLLESNGRRPGEFEEGLREDLVRNQLMELAQNTSKVSAQEIESEFLLTEDQRQVDYVFIKASDPAKPTDNEALSKEVLQKVTSMSASALKTFLKTKNLELKTSDKFNRLQNHISGLGELTELQKDAFTNPSSLQKEPKLYKNMQNYVIAWNLKSFSPITANLEKEKEKLAKTISARKEQLFFTNWKESLQKQAKITMNDELANSKVVEVSEE